MPKYLFVSQRTTKFEDIVEADTQDEAVKIFEELIADEMNIVDQYFQYGTYGLEVD
jgi:hypothetical protein